MWRFWIDVGGTFTDCLAISPDGNQHQTKVLSSGVTKGSISRFDSDRIIVSVSFGGYPAGFWAGATLSLIDAHGRVLKSTAVRSFSVSDRQQRFELQHVITADTARLTRQIELSAGVHAPIVAIRQIMGLPISRPIPDCQVQLGTTRGTNALLTRSGAKVALITSAGFRDLLKIGDQARPHLFQLAIKKSAPLFFQAEEVSARILSDGTVRQPIDENAVREMLDALQRSGVTSIAVCLMHSFRFPQHERIVGRLASAAGFEEVRLSHEVSPLIKIVPRAETTVLDAYLNPVIRSYLDEIENELSNQSTLRLMTSAGGLVRRANFSGKDSVLSGPAGGVVGAVRIGQQAGFEKVIGFDMGGTSTDVSRFDGRFEMEFESRKAGVRMLAPMLAIETVAAGGGSVCWFDGTRLQVGPQSAGSNPGPACYGKDGPLTVTDINLFLGRIDEGLFPFALDQAATARKLERLCDELQQAGYDYTPTVLAEGFLSIANNNMAAAIESVSVRKGYDPKDYALLSFGGAGAQHCCAVAERLGIKTILDHRQSSILSAVGIALAEETAHAVKGVLRSIDETSDAFLKAVFAKLEQQVAWKLKNSNADLSTIKFDRRLEVRYEGLDAALLIDADDVGSALPLFLQKHQQFYGYTQDRMVEVVAARLQGTLPRESQKKQHWPSFTDRNFQVDHGAAGASLLRSSLTVGDSIPGPAMIVDVFSTTIIDAGWVARVGPEANLRIEQLELETAVKTDRTAVIQRADPVELEIFNQHFASIAAQMGLCLQKTSISVNVKERLDFSCAIFTSLGDLVVNAPHIPVHLGAMSATVREIIRLNPEVDSGDVFVTNDPYGGGSHLPDVTVVSPVYVGTGTDGSQPAFWVASRSHHAEIGGKTPGSMPPDAVSLAEEGVLISNFKLVDRGKEKFEELERLLSSGSYPSRSVRENLADIRAQIAANQSGSRDLVKLVLDHGRQKVMSYMGFIQDAAAVQCRAAIGDLSDGEYTFSDVLDNRAMICVRVLVDGQSMTIDFDGTDAVLAGNQNANPAIVRSAVMYVLRMLIQSDIPLNEGVMKPVTVTIPENCFLNPGRGKSPKFSPPVVGGNVETSQRVVDVLLGALGIAAASQGTMNNWLMGDATFGYYETIGGGSGATKDSAGADAVHVHMTNTRLTDPEILETRYPVVLREFSIRRDSGGKGKQRGGDGMVREVEFLKPLQVSLLTNRRNCSPWGLGGGEDGKAGRNILIRLGGARADLPSSAQLEVDVGDVLRLETPGGGGFGMKN